MPTDLLRTVQERLASSQRFACTCGDRELVVTGFDDRTPTRSVIVAEHREEHALIFVVRICDAKVATPERVLRLAATIGAGALGLVASSYVARYVVPAASVTTAPVEWIVGYLRDLAASMDEHLRTTRQDVSSLAHFAG